MASSFELSNIKNLDEADFITRFVNLSIRNSNYTLTAGAPSDAYVDVDKSIMKNKMSEEIGKRIASKINDLIKEGQEFDKLAFIDNDSGGPVGMMSLHSEILNLVKKESVIIRPRKELTRESIKGNIKPNDRVLIINDVATTGETIHEAASKVWSFGGKVPFAIVYFDREEGATQNLLRKGITLYSYVTNDSIKKLNGIKVKPHTAGAVLKDFGGNAITLVK